MELSIFTLIPPLVAIIMVLVTKRVILSLGAGIVTGALLLEEFSLLASLKVVVMAFIEVFYNEGTWNLTNIFILGFLCLLGILTAFISFSGGSAAFGTWALKRVKTRTGAKILTVVLGFVFFVDDYFNALALGQISRPITDQHKISRAKLAYFIDSTSAPKCVISPLSSWGAYIITLITAIFTMNGITEISGLSAFIQMIPMNFYAITTLTLVILVAIFPLDFGKMKQHELLAARGELFDSTKEVPGQLNNTQHLNGGVIHLILPISTLLIVTIIAMIVTGYQAIGTFNLFGILENTEVTKSLFIGGLISVAVSLFLLVVRLKRDNKEKKWIFISKSVIQGIQSTVSAVLILIFAWTLSSIISQVQTGAYLASLVEQFNVAIYLLPLLLFIISGIMAFSTGTSWGAFGILLPIAGSISVNVDSTIMLPAMAAVLAGSVFGDHSSPITGTTILSSTSAGSPLMDHVITQFPYTILCVVVSMLGFLVLGITTSVWLGLIISEVALIIFLLLLVKFSPKNKQV